MAKCSLTSAGKRWRLFCWPIIWWLRTRKLRMRRRMRRAPRMRNRPLRGCHFVVKRLGPFWPAACWGIGGMKMAQFAKILIAALTLWAGLSARAAEIVYDNSTTYSQTDYESVDEYGDEVIL